MPLVSTNPATGETIATFPTIGDREIDSRINTAHHTAQVWRTTPVSARSEALRKIAIRLRQQRSALAALITREMGKPIAQSHREIEKCADVCDYYAEHGPAALHDWHPPGAPDHRWVSFRPMGVVLAIMPWNFPFWQVFRAAAPALLAGNTVLLKPAPNVTLCSQAIEALITDSTGHSGLLQLLLTENRQTSDLVGDNRIAMVTMTGSREAGQQIAARAGAVMKPGIFELGGSDPYLIFHDADITAAAQACTRSRLYNNGQSCVAAKRIIVVEPVRQQFEEAFVAEMQKYRPSSPTADDCELGPLVSQRGRDRLHAQVLASVAHGANIVLGGVLPAMPGFYYPPTVLTAVEPSMPAFDEELFGPVAALITAPDETAAIKLANASRFGLGAAIFTRDMRRGEMIAREQLETGIAFVNEEVRSHNTLPFGGIKESGYGRELGELGLRAFTHAKTLGVKPT